MIFGRMLAVLALSLIATSPALADRLELTVDHATQSFDRNTSIPVVSLILDEASTRAFADFTTENVGKATDLYVGDEILASPVIREPIVEGEMQISGDFTVEDANRIAVSLAQGDIRVSVALQE